MEQAFQALASQAPVMLWMANPCLDRTWANPAWLQFTGQTLEAIVGDGWVQGVHPDDRQACVEAYRAAARTHQGLELRYRVRHAERDYRWVVDRAEPHVTPAGAIVGYIGTLTDATESHRLVAAWRESEARFRTFLSHGPIMAFLKDSTGTYRWTNRPLGRGHEAAGKTDDEVWPSDVAIQCRSSDLRVLRSGQAEERVQAIPQTDGTVRYWRITKFPILDQSGDPLIGGVGIDISEQRALEERVRQGQPLEVMSRLAGGVAHDCNNWLTAILGYADLLAQRMPPDDPLRRYPVLIQQAGAHARSLTTHLLTVSRQQHLDGRPIELNSVVRRTLTALEQEIGEQIETRLLLAMGLPLVLADPVQMEQVVLNLVLNARDAMPAGGLLTVATSVVQILPGHPGGGEVEAGRYVQLTVRDTGEGMDVATQARIFEPFFTTKEPGRGTGLGLATVAGIVKQRGGVIAVTSAPGQGTTMAVLLPLREPDPSRASGPEAP